MNVLRIVGVLSVVAAVGLMGGCEKTIEVTFVNTTRNTIQVEMEVPAQGIYEYGVAGSMGGRVAFEITVPEDELPTAIRWDTGEASGAFNMNKRTDDRLFIYIKQDGEFIGPVNENTRVNITSETEVQQIRVDQHEAVQ